MNLAPNGKPSNLTAEQYKLVRTPPFKKWFGDWENDAKNSSKVVDENGEPLVVYHGTDKEFFIFDKKEFGKNSGSNLEKIFFSSNKKIAKSYAIYSQKETKKEAIIIESFLNLKNPIFVDGNDYQYYEIADIINENSAKDLVIKNVFDGIGESAIGIKSTIFAVTKPTQIKLADGTNTTFDSNNPDIRYKEGGTTNAFNYTIGGL